MKLILLSLTLFLRVLSFGQNIENIYDYFVPVADKNKAIFYTPNKAGEKTDNTTTICYVRKFPKYEITTSSSFEGKVVSTEKMIVEFSPTEVKMIGYVQTTMTGKKYISNFPSSPVTMLLLPENVGTSTWWSSEISGNRVFCTCRWVTINVDGKPTKVIKVIKEYEGLKIDVIEYYVKGIGLWQISMTDNNDETREIYNQFDGLSYDPTIDK